MRCGWLLSLLVLVPATVLRAQPVAKAPPSEVPATQPTAEEAYEEGKRFFEQESYEEAEAAWQRSLQLGADPRLLIGIAEIREQSGDIAGATKALQSYLERKPDAPDRETIEARIGLYRKSPAVLAVKSVPEGIEVMVDGKPTGQKTPTELTLPAGAHTVALWQDGVAKLLTEVQLGFGARQELLLQEQVAPEPEAPDADPRNVKPAIWTMTGLSAASLVTGTVLGIMALKEQDRYRENPTASSADRGERLALFADLSLGLALLSGVTAMVLHFTTRNRGERATARFELAPDLGRKRSGVTARLRF